MRTNEIGKMNNQIYADPNTDAQRFQKACEDANDFAKRQNYDTIVFVNHLGFYFIRELKFTEPAIEQLYCALAKFNATAASKKRVAWKQVGNHRTR